MKNKNTNESFFFRQTLSLSFADTQTLACSLCQASIWYTHNSVVYVSITDGWRIGLTFLRQHWLKLHRTQIRFKKKQKKKKRTCVRDFECVFKTKFSPHENEIQSWTVFRFCWKNLDSFSLDSFSLDSLS